MQNPQIHHRGIVITKTPFRISFFGGGTDFSDFFNQHGGAVLGATINKYLYVTLNSLERFYDKKIRLSYSKLECVDDSNELEHTLAKTILYDHLQIGSEEFVDIHTFADLPASSGVGSSSAFTVGMLNAVYALRGVYKFPQQIAKEAVYIERERLRDAGGWQDQYFAAFGGFNKIEFFQDQARVTPVTIEHARVQALQNSCLLIFTGGVRSSSSIQAHFKQRSEDKISMLLKTKALVNDAMNILNNARNTEELVYEFGHLLHVGWELKQSMSSTISNDGIDALYQKALKAGAIGGKLCGAGGGGFLLLMVPPKLMEKVKVTLGEQHQLMIEFDPLGSRILYGDIH